MIANSLRVLTVISGFVGSASWSDAALAANLTTLVSFNGANGAYPQARLLVDANGNLFGTTIQGGLNDQGTVFQIARTVGGYASAPTTLVSFNGGNGANPAAGLLADANGNVFGTTFSAEAISFGTVFKIAKSTGGYVSAPITLVRFNGANGANPQADLIADAKGNLFGTTKNGGASDQGTVFEVAKTPGGYASTIISLVSFNGVNGRAPVAGLIADPDGNLFGTTAQANGAWGTVFKIAKTTSGYAGAPITLVTFDVANGANPVAALIADANGNFYGTTTSGGANGWGTVFMVAKTAAGYANASTLVSFDGANGAVPFAGLIADATGNLYGTTLKGGANSIGTAFKIDKTATGYASVPITLVSFNGANGADPRAGLIADANGNLFGTTSLGGANNLGTVFKITDSGFVVPPIFAGTPGQANCQGKSASALAKQYGGLNTAAYKLGFSSAAQLQDAIKAFCAKA